MKNKNNKGNSFITTNSEIYLRYFNFKLSIKYGGGHLLWLKNQNSDG